MGPMHLLSRAARRIACVFPLLLLAQAPVDAKPVRKAAAPAAAPTKPAQTGPWLYRGSDIPHDKEWIFGELPNGLRYAVRRNGVPPGQVSIRIRMDVGSLYETDAERGYAHLLEHMVFRQSKYLGDGEAIPTWQRLGATFGSDTNAVTSPVSTTFKIDLPEATPAGLDESFKLLSGMMIAPTLSAVNLRADVPIVLAEKRESGGKAERIANASQETLFAGQRLAVRSPIGTVATLEGATEASVRAFHARWYRPERAAIIAAGDVDPARLEELIKKYFADWKVPGKPAAEPFFGDPLPPKGAKGAAPVGETRVLVEPDTPRELTLAVLRPWRPVRDTVVYNQGKMVDNLAATIISRRLETRARAGASFLSAGIFQDRVLRSADMTAVIITPIGPDWKKALSEVRGVIADALAKPPTMEEIAREVAELNVVFESEVEQRTLMPGGSLADTMTGALDIRETVATPEVVLDIFNRSRPLFTPANLLASTRRIFAGSVTRAFYVTPKAGEADAAALRQALVAPIKADANSRSQFKQLSFADLPALGTPGRLVAAEPTVVEGLDQLTFENGIKVLLLPSADEPGRVALKVRWGAGQRSFGTNEAALATLGDLALVPSGEGPLDQEQIDRITAGRKMGFQFSIDDTAFEFAGDTRAADLADQLYLFAAKFTQPRWDVAPLDRAKSIAQLQYEAMAASPGGVLQRDLGWLQRGRDPRYASATPAQISAVTAEAFRAKWQPLLAEGPMEVQLYGDFDRDKAVEALKKTFGALAARAPLAGSLAPLSPATMPPSVEPIVLTHRGDKGQAAAVIAWPTGGGMAGIQESRQLEILTQVAQNRLLDALREKLGAAYSPQMANDWPTGLEGGGAVLALAQVDPKSVPVFFATADQIAADLIARPPSADELTRVTEPIKQAIERNLTGKSYLMGMLEGATLDPRKYEALRTLRTDLTQTTPEKMQALAKKYLRREASWRVAILPEAAPRAQ